MLLRASIKYLAGQSVVHHRAPNPAMSNIFNKPSIRALRMFINKQEWKLFGCEWKEKRILRETSKNQTQNCTTQ